MPTATSCVLRPAKLHLPWLYSHSQIYETQDRPISSVNDLANNWNIFCFHDHCTARILDKIPKHITQYLQIGLWQKHCTMHIFVNLLRQIRNVLDSNKIAVCIFVDFQKVIHTVEQNILFNKHDHYGFRGNMNNWFKTLVCRKSSNNLFLLIVP